MDKSTLKSMLLIPTSMAIPVYVTPEAIVIGQTVFQDFVHEEFEQEGIPDEVLLEQDEELLAQAETIEENDEAEQNHFVDENFATAHRFVFQSGHNSNIVANVPQGYKNTASVQVGATLRRLANDFARSSQRDDVKRLANGIGLNNLSQDSFWQLLEETFRDGINRYNLIALFYFCSDVLIRCFKLKLKEIGLNLFKWALNYITQRVCRWVCEHGGWERVVQTGIIQSKYMFAAACAILVAIGWFSFKNSLK